MTGMPSGRPSEPRTGPAAPAPAHGDGPTRPSAPTGPTELRDRIAQEIHLHCPARPYGGNCRCTTLADAVMPVVEAETAGLDVANDNLRALLAEQRQRAENAEDRLRKAADAYTRLHAEAMDAEAARDRWRQRAEQAERALAQARDTIADERRGRLTAEAAVRRAREVARNRIAVPSDVLREALTIEQPKENP